MKKIALAVTLASVSFFALADTWVAKSQSGGEIILSNRECTKDKRLFQGYNVQPGGKTVWFCWAIVDDRIMAAYEDGSTYTYSPSGFVKQATNEKPKTGGSYVY